MMFKLVKLIGCLTGQKRTQITFCSCSPDAIHLLGHGYLSCAPVFPQTAFSLRLLNFYDLVWNICNSHVTPFSEVMRRWNESLSIRLCAKNSNKVSATCSIFLVS
jgi:hypothetical protein